MITTVNLRIDVNVRIKFNLCAEATLLTSLAVTHPVRGADPRHQAEMLGLAMTFIRTESELPRYRQGCQAYPLDETRTVNDSHKLSPLGSNAPILDSLARLREQVGRTTSAASILPPHLLEGISLASRMSKAMEGIWGDSAAQYAEHMRELNDALAWRSALLEDLKHVINPVQPPSFEDMFPDLKINAALAWQKELAATESWQNFLQLSMGMTSAIADIAKSISTGSMSLSSEVDWRAIVPDTVELGGARNTSEEAPRTVEEIRRAIGEDELAGIRASLRAIQDEQSRAASTLRRTDAKEPPWKTIAVQVLVALLVTIVTEAVKLAFGYLEAKEESSPSTPADAVADVRTEAIFAVSSDGATLFSGPATTQRTVALLSHGDLVKVLKVQGRWANVATITSDRILVVGWIKTARIHSLTQTLLDSAQDDSDDNGTDGSGP